MPDESVRVEPSENKTEPDQQGIVTAGKGRSQCEERAKRGKGISFWNEAAVPGLRRNFTSKVLFYSNTTFLFQCYYIDIYFMSFNCRREAQVAQQTEERRCVCREIAEFAGIVRIEIATGRS